MSNIDPFANVEYQNWLALQSKAAAAVAANETFLANAATVTYPLSTAEQTALVNQVVALTRQVDALIRFALGELTDTGGT